MPLLLPWMGFLATPLSKVKKIKKKLMNFNESPSINRLLRKVGTENREETLREGFHVCSDDRGGKKHGRRIAGSESARKDGERERASERVTVKCLCVCVKDVSAG